MRFHLQAAYLSLQAERREEHYRGGRNTAGDRRAENSARELDLRPACAMTLNELPALMEPLAAGDFFPSERRQRAAGQTNCEAGRGGEGRGGGGDGGIPFLG